MSLKLVDMRKSAEEKAEDMMTSPWSPGPASEYPYGLCICLTEAELEKLGADHEGLEIGDIFDIRAMARVTSVSENETEAGKTCRVEMQIVMMGVESEDEEVDEPISRVKQPKRKSRLYKD